MSTVMEPTHTAQPGSLSSFEIERRRVFRHHFTVGQKWRLFFDEFATPLLMRCCIEGRPYSVFGYKGKQVRDNIHSWELLR